MATATEQIELITPLGDELLFHGMVAHVEILRSVSPDDFNSSAVCASTKGCTSTVTQTATTRSALMLPIVLRARKNRRAHLPGRVPWLIS